MKKSIIHYNDKQGKSLWMGIFLLVGMLFFTPSTFAQTDSTEFEGCTDPQAMNYDPNALWDNGTCLYEVPDTIDGCTDPQALNYDPEANYDNGTCVYHDPDTIPGCTDTMAFNYNPLANIDDGTCHYSNLDTIDGCMDPLALNYNPAANYDNGTCVYHQEDTILGCTDMYADNFNPDATFDDGSCQYADTIGGCTDPLAFNFDPWAIYDDGTCLYPIDSCAFLDCNDCPTGIWDAAGNCVEDVIFGCTDPQATNYDPLANMESGACVYDIDSVLYGCLDPAANNYNPYALMEDGSCEYVDSLINDHFENCELNFSIDIDDAFISNYDLFDGYVLVEWTIIQDNQHFHFHIIYLNPWEGETVVTLHITCDQAQKGASQKGTDGFTVSDNVNFSVIASSEDTYEAQDLTIFPNPVSNIMNIEVPASGNATVEILNASGLVLSTESKLVGANGVTSVSTDFLESGVYLVKVTLTNGAYYITSFQK